LNPLSAFSFGKIIKTFIPGLIATLALAFIIELLHLWTQKIPASELAVSPLWLTFRNHSYFCTSSPTQGANVAVVGAIVLPLALTLGFFLNTIHWLWFHRFFANKAREERRKDVNFSALEDSLMAEANFLVQVVSPGVTFEEPALQHVFLPFVDLERLHYLRESYFSWYEFQVNSAKAWLLSLLAYMAVFVALALHWSICLQQYAFYLGIPLVLSIIVVLVLWKAALCNLVRYEERFLLFLAGSLYLVSRN